MPKFESPLGSKQFSGQTMREVSVSDETQMPQQQQPMPRAHRHAAPVLDEAAMRDFQNRLQPPAPPIMREMTAEEESILAAKKAQREGKERLSEGAKRRIELLIGMTRLSKDVEIADQMYKLQTLTSQELREAITASSEFDGNVQFIFETRKQLLARSLVVVAGVEIDQFLNSNNLDAKLDFIERLDHALLVRLYNEYTKLSQEAQDKYAMKTEGQVKEVLEDLKKP